VKLKLGILEIATSKNGLVIENATPEQRRLIVELVQMAIAGAVPSEYILANGTSFSPENTSTPTNEYPVSTELKVLDWAREKGILAKGTPQTQVKKLLEEVLELKAAIANEPHHNQVIELGDVLVVTAILAEMLGTTSAAALAAAYQKISRRTGKMVDGVFVKD
jgi:NTP pyrophosphatase (non-canonical NTP hydrolase)